MTAASATADDDRAMHAAPAAAAAVPALPQSVQAALSPDETVLLVLKPSMLFIPLSSLGTLLASLIVALLLAYSAQFAWSPWTDAHAVAVGGTVAALRLARAWFEWWGHVYVLTDRRVIARRGILRTVMQEAPLPRLQNTVVVQSLRERVFGLGTIGFATAGRSTFDAFWETVRQPFAVHRAVLETVERYGRR